MRIEFGEHDGYLYDDGKPRIFTFRVDGRIFPCPADVAIGDFYGRVMKSPLIAPTRLESQEQIPSSVADIMVKAIRKGDIVKLIAKVDAEADTQLKTGNPYQVIEVSKNELDIIDQDTRDRFTVLKADVELLSKGLKPGPKVLVLETVKKCVCGEEVVCQKIDGEYYGKCGKCQAEVTVGVAV